MRRLSITTCFLLVFIGVTFVTTFWYAAWHGYSRVEQDRKLIRERDILFARTLAQSLSVHMRANAESIERLAGELADDPLTLESLIPRLENFAIHSRSFSIVSVADLDGNIYVVHDKLGETGATDINISDRDYFQEMLRTKDTVISNAITSRFTPIPTIGIETPIFGPDGSIRAYLLSGLNLDEIYRLAEGALGSEFAVPVVLDKTGQIILHPDEELVASHRLLKDFAPAQLALKGETGFLDAFIDVDGVERSAAYTSVEELGWAVWVAQDTIQFAVSRERATQEALGLGAIMGVSVLLATLLVSRPLLQPIRMTANAARDIVEKQTLYQVIPQDKGWITKESVYLSDAFNKLLARVRETMYVQEKALEMKSRFLTVATHAFRTPLTVLRWSTDELVEKKKSVPAETRANIYEGTQRLVLGFENLFAALEIQEQTVHAVFKKTNLSKLGRESVDRLRPLAVKNEVKVQYKDGKNVTISCDQTKMQRLFDILISNGVFYSDRGDGVTVTVTDDADNAYIIVRDKGIGIAKEDLPHVYQAFFRGTDAALKYTDGTGLGLYIAKEYVKLHHGSIDISSEKGGGTEVTVRLPKVITFG